MTTSPSSGAAMWETIFDQLRTLADGRALVTLHDTRHFELLAGGARITELPDVPYATPERVAAAVARRLDRRLGTRLDPALFGPTREAATATEETRDLVLRCQRIGLPLTFVPSPWLTVLGLVCRYEDALALMQLYEDPRGTLVAGRRDVGDVLEARVASERSVAALLADTLCRATSDDAWSYGDLYAPTRGMSASPDELDAFAARCRTAGAPLAYDRMGNSAGDP